MNGILKFSRNSLIKFDFDGYSDHTLGIEMYLIAFLEVLDNRKAFYFK